MINKIIVILSSISNPVYKITIFPNDKMVRRKYSGDPNSVHLNTRNIQIPDVLTIRFLKSKTIQNPVWILKDLLTWIVLMYKTVFVHKILFDIFLPFKNWTRTKDHHLKIGHVRYSDPHCTVNSMGLKIFICFCLAMNDYLSLNNFHYYDSNLNVKQGSRKTKLKAKHINRGYS